MPESYLSLSSAEQKDILQTAANKLNRKESVLEKDIWVCWVLQVLFSIPNRHPMAFKGGTSLSRCYNFINRFSEDIDITLDYRHFKEHQCYKFDSRFDPFLKGASNTQIKKFSAHLKDLVKKYIKEVVVPYFHKQPDILPPSTQKDIVVDDAGEKVWVQFPSVIESPDEYLRSEVLVEFGGRNVTTPNEEYTLSPYTSTIPIGGLEFPTANNVVALSAERTFWEKATLIHAECNRKQFNENANRLSRHWYDLAMLVKNEVGQAAIKDRVLLEEVVKHKKIFFKAGYANYDACLENALKLLPEDSMMPHLKLDYKKMVNAGMIYDSPPKFDEIITLIRKIEHGVNSM